MTKGTELEAAIQENPKNLENWAVYGDWLQSQNDPRGEMIALELKQTLVSKDDYRD